MGESFSLRWDRSRKVKITMLTEDNLTPVIKKVRVKDGWLTLTMPKTELALFAVEEI